MATITPTVTNDIAGDGSVKQADWALTTADADGLAMELGPHADMTFTATGTWGGATCAIEGSADGSTWMALNNLAGGSAATATANKCMAIIEKPRYVRPRLSTAGTNAAVTVTLVARRPTPMRT